MLNIAHIGNSISEAVEESISRLELPMKTIDNRLEFGVEVFTERYPKGIKLVAGKTSTFIEVVSVEYDIRFNFKHDLEKAAQFFLSRLKLQES